MRRAEIRRTAWLALAAVIFLLSSGCSVPEGMITGSVAAPLNSGGLPDLSQARVEVAGFWSRESAQVKPDGFFVLMLPQGTYNVTIDHPWYPQISLGRVRVPFGGMTNLTLSRFNNFHFLFIGINDYSDPLMLDLHGCVADADALRSAWVKGESGSRNILEAGASHELTDASATKEGIHQAIQTMLAESSSGDTLVLTFAGHGGSVARNNDAGASDHYLAYIVPSDAKSGNLFTYITEDELKEWFSARPDIKVVFVFDSCASAAMVQSLSQTVQAQNLDLPGFVVFMGSQVAGISYEDVFEGQARGVFSYFLARGLEEALAADMNRDGDITVMELFAYARTQTIQHSMASGYAQYPQFRTADSSLLIYRYEP